MIFVLRLEENVSMISVNANRSAIFQIAYRFILGKSMTKRNPSNVSVKKRREAAAQKAAAQRRQRNIIFGVVAVIVLAFVGYFVWQALNPAVEPAVVEGERPLAALAPADREGYYSAAPPMTIDTAKKYEAIFNMQDGGEMRLALFADAAPITVNNFVFLANQGFYDNTTFHRVLDGFMAQGGDPTGSGGGGPGYRFEDEVDNGLSFDRPALLAMANAGPNTNGSQFFITYDIPQHLNGLHTIFGEMAAGEDVLNNLTQRDPLQNPSFTGDVIESIVVVEN